MTRTAPLAVSVGLAVLALVRPVSAHISLEQGGTHLSRYGDATIKAGPCGKAGGTRGTNIYTYEPGQTITVSIVEYVAHPSYFRIAFQANGDNEFKEPASIKPIDPSRPCPIDSGDHCGKTDASNDFYNTPNVLPGMDNLNPHLAAAGMTPKYTWQVALPNVECDNCTLQIIQVMEDNAFHGDYDPTPGVGVEDIYHQCIDLVLKHGAALVDGGMPAVGDAGTMGGGGSGGAGGGGNGGAGGTSRGSGCATTGAAAAGDSAAAASLLLGVGLLLSRRRRARR